MAAATGSAYRTYSEVDRHVPILFQLQAANTTIHKNALAVKVSGKAQPYVLGAAGQTLLGNSEGTYVAGSTDLVQNRPPMVFKQGVFEYASLATDPPLVADIGSPVTFADDSTVQHSTGSNSITAVLKYITPAGMCGVEVKNP